MLSDLELRAALQMIPNSTVEVSEQGGRFVATVISSYFAGLDEADRQAMVWEALLQRLSEPEQSQVEYVFTLTPDEAIEHART